MPDFKKFFEPGEGGFYDEKNNRVMKVMPGLGEDNWKGRRKDGDYAGSGEGWKCMANLPWRKSKHEAAVDLATLSMKKKWRTVWRDKDGTVHVV